MDYRADNESYAKLQNCLNISMHCAIPRRLGRILDILIRQLARIVSWEFGELTVVSDSIHLEKQLSRL